MCTKRHVQELFPGEFLIIAPYWKNSKYPSMKELINNFWHIHTAECYISVRINEMQIHQHGVVCQTLIWGKRNPSTKWHTVYCIKVGNRQMETDRQPVIFGFRIAVILNIALMAEKRRWLLNCWYYYFLIWVMLKGMCSFCQNWSRCILEILCTFTMLCISSKTKSSYQFLKLRQIWANNCAASSTNGLPRKRIWFDLEVI